MLRFGASQVSRQESCGKGRKPEQQVANTFVLRETPSAGLLQANSAYATDVPRSKAQLKRSALIRAGGNNAKLTASPCWHGTLGCRVMVNGDGCACARHLRLMDEPQQKALSISAMHLLWCREPSWPYMLGVSTPSIHTISALMTCCCDRCALPGGAIH